MQIRNENKQLTIGRRLAELRKKTGLSQSQLASKLTPKKTQAWVSTVESGSRNINVLDLIDIARILETPVVELLGDLPVFPERMAKPLSTFIDDINSRLPIEMPLYLQRDLDSSNPAPVDYQYASVVPGEALFSKDHPLAGTGSMSVMVVERYYHSPKLDVTDLVTVTGALVPIMDSDIQKTDRVLIKLNDPYDGLLVHPGLIKPDGSVQLTIAKTESVVFENHEFVILGVLIMRRTMYRSSVMRRWLHQKFDIFKEELET